jgi:hypothetical protein
MRKTNKSFLDLPERPPPRYNQDMRLIVGTLVFITTLLSPAISHAGIWEIGASGSYRRQNISQDAVDEAQSITGSLSFYFNEQSALELSYTDGISKRSISPNDINGHTTSSIYKSIGLDFIYTFGDGAIRPYVKGGTQYLLVKKIIDQYKVSAVAYQETTVETSPSFVPSAGLGFKMSLTNSLSLKAGIDAWTSDALSVQPVKIDYAGRVGLSWMFM